MKLAKISCIGLGAAMTVGLIGCGESQQQETEYKGLAVETTKQETAQKEMTPEEKCLSVMREIRQLMLACGIDSEHALSEEIINSFSDGSMPEDGKLELMSQIQTTNMDLIREYSKVLKLVTSEDRGKHLDQYDLRELFVTALTGKDILLQDVINIHNDMTTHIEQTKILNDLVVEMGGEPFDVGEQAIKILKGDAADRQKLIKDASEMINRVKSYKKVK